jgi:hypothetical protein
MANVSTSDTAKMTIIDANINDSVRTICNLHGGKLRFLETTKNMYTVANQEAYQIPNSFRKLIDIYFYSGPGVSSSDVIYTPEMIFDPTKYKRVKQAKYGTQAVPYFVYVENRKFYVQPIPSTTGNMITLRGRLNTRDLLMPDYTTSTILAATNGGTTIIGNAPSWTADMVGRYIQITETSAANGGDGFWYEIGAYVSATEITLTKPYEGTSIVGGTAAYTIGQVSAIPEAYDVGICYRAAALWWQNQNDLVRSKSYWMQYDGGNEAGFSQGYGGIIGQMIVTEGETEEGSYIPPFGSSSTFPNQGPYYFPYQDGSGF